MDKKKKYMKVSLNWLKKYIDTKITAKALVDKLTNAGLEVGAVEQKGNDTVFEIEITSNRPDWLSMIGIAREVAAVTNARKIKQPKALPLKSKIVKNKSFSIEIKDKKGCPRYVGRLIKDVKIGPSPAWIKTSLEAIDARIINNGADITNYCLYETGQPMHAFDFDKIEGKKIIVRRAKKGEKITTIDGVKRDLDESILIIADSEKPIAIAGIMGGIDTEVSNKTKNILLESAYFDPITIRRASRKLGLSTESNYRFERKVDTENVLFSSCRGAYLLKEICSCNTDDPYLDVNYIKKTQTKVQLKTDNVERLIGLKVSASRIKSILQSLGFTVKAGKKNSFTVIVPSFRNDIKLEEDLIEEIARIEGYDKIKEAMPPIKAHLEPACTTIYQAKAKIRQILLGQGLNEVMTYSLLSQKNLDDANSDVKNRINIQNPLSAEQEMLRNSFIPSLLKVINTNLNRRIKEVKIFEIGNIYNKNNGKFEETEYATIALTGTSLNNWKDHSRKVAFYDLKGIVENIIRSFGILNYRLKEEENVCFASSESAVMISNAKEIAVLGKINKQILKNFDITEDVYYAHLPISLLTKSMKKEYRYSPVPKYPSVIRDIALVVKKNISTQAALDIIKEVGGELAVKTELFDVYTGNQVPRDCKSLAFSIEYQSREATLTEEQVNNVHDAVQDALLSRLKASLR